MTNLVVDEVVIVDWSAAASPKLGKDSIWIAHVATGSHPDLLNLVNMPTRSVAVDWLVEVFGEAKHAGRHLVCGLDFSFGYPAGYAELLTQGFPDALGGTTPFERVVSVTESLIADSPTNENNRFEAADLINSVTGHALFWGHPPTRSFTSLSPTKALPQELAPNPLPTRRHTEVGLAVQSNWQLTGVGAVGSQVLMGIPVLAKLHRSALGPKIWPFQPHELAAKGGAVVLAEVWPSMFAQGEMTHEIRDAWQVETTALALAKLTNFEWAELFAPTSWESFSAQELQEIVLEEGWILGKT